MLTIHFDEETTPPPSPKVIYRQNPFNLHFLIFSYRSGMIFKSTNGVIVPATLASFPNEQFVIIASTIEKKKNKVILL